MKAIKTEPTIFVIFGGTGDLNARKITPALYHLFIDKWLPEKFAIIGTGRTKLTNEAFQANLFQAINQFSRSGKVDVEKWKAFAEHITYESSDVNDAASFNIFSERIVEKQKEWNLKPNIIYYLAVAPQLFPQIAQNISQHKLCDDISKTRIVIEKPFGHDLESARSLNKLLQGIFDEKQIYRIDHYLGKETVQNILALRFANALYEPLWNRKYIDHVQISVTEQLGVGERSEYYESSGALRDMIQNHLLQLLCLVAMEPPIAFSADEVRNRKVEVLRAMRKFGPEDIRLSTVRGQYSSGWMQGTEVKGYREEDKVAPDSNTETFAAIKFFIDNWRWQGVPFYVRTGKRLHESTSIISIQFKDVPHSIFPSEVSESWQQNRLIISIQPEMSIRLQVQAKRPGLQMMLNPVDMVFDYDGTYTTDTPEAYETLLVDAMLGDQTLFMRSDQVEAAWELVMPIISAWESKTSLSFPNYSADSWGPELAEALIARDGYHWFALPNKSKK